MLGASEVVSGVNEVVLDGVVLAVEVDSVTVVGFGVVVFFLATSGNDGAGLLSGKSKTESAKASQQDKTKRIFKVYQ